MVVVQEYIKTLLKIFAILANVPLLPSIKKANNSKVAPARPKTTNELKKLIFCFSISSNEVTTE